MALLGSRNGEPSALFVDSSVWLAFFSARDGRHADADRWMRAAINARIPLVTTNLVLAEVQRLVLHRVGIAAAAAVLAHIDASRSVRVKFTDAETHAVARAMLARFPDQKLTYTDATSFAVMRAAGWRFALSLDSDFVIAGFTLWDGEGGQRVARRPRVR